MCLDLNTGKRFWYFQLVHHDIWDRDIPSPPILMDINVNGRAIKAVAQPTKQAFIYTFDRVTGEPVWPIVETPVPKGNVPTEWYAATQPYPTKPAPFDRQGVAESDLIDWTPEIKAGRFACRTFIRWRRQPVRATGGNRHGRQGRIAPDAGRHWRRELGGRHLRS